MVLASLSTLGDMLPALNENMVEQWSQNLTNRSTKSA